MLASYSLENHSFLIFARSPLKFNFYSLIFLLLFLVLLFTIPYRAKCEIVLYLTIARIVLS